MSIKLRYRRTRISFHSNRQNVLGTEQPSGGNLPAECFSRVVSLRRMHNLCAWSQDNVLNVVCLFYILYPYSYAESRLFMKGWLIILVPSGCRSS